MKINLSIPCQNLKQPCQQEWSEVEELNKTDRGPVVSAIVEPNKHSFI